MTSRVIVTPFALLMFGLPSVPAMSGTPQSVEFVQDIEATLAPIKVMLDQINNLISVVSEQRRTLDNIMRKMTDVAEEKRLTEQITGLDDTLITLEKNRSRLSDLLAEAEGTLRSVSNRQ